MKFRLLDTRVKKTSLGESLAGSHAYNPIRDSRWHSWRDFLARKVLPTVSPRLVFFYAGSCYKNTDSIL